MTEIRHVYALAGGEFRRNLNFFTYVKTQYVFVHHHTKMGTCNENCQVLNRPQS